MLYLVFIHPNVLLDPGLESWGARVGGGGRQREVGPFVLFLSPVLAVNSPDLPRIDICCPSLICTELSTKMQIIFELTTVAYYYLTMPHIAQQRPFLTPVDPHPRWARPPFEGDQLFK